MTESSTAHAADAPFDATSARVTTSPRERSNVFAVVVGAAFGAVAFALCALWLGPVASLVIAVVSTLPTWRRRERAALAFVVAGALSAAALRPSATFALLGGLVYGLGLALAAQRSRGEELLA